VGDLPAARIHHHRRGAPQASLEALRAADATSYFKDGNTLWVKLVVDNSAGAT
jgi:cell migration-inducing and hyaluronan-binding protein